jgi:hypothetical protein
MRQFKQIAIAAVALLAACTLTTSAEARHFGGGFHGGGFYGGFHGFHGGFGHHWAGGGYGHWRGRRFWPYYGYAFYGPYYGDYYDDYYDNYYDDDYDYDYCYWRHGRRYCGY